MIEKLALRYPQLVMPIQEGIHETEEYKKVCLRGLKTERTAQFIGNELDKFEKVSTPAGDVEIVYMADRQDFEHAYMALGNRCEPMHIAKSTGAVTLYGINNWEKVRKLGIFLKQVDKSEYKDTIILLSRGPYSNVSGDAFGIDQDEWLLKSYIIRKYHELTHFISRRLFPDNKNAIRDEVLADMMGLYFAFGSYDTTMAKVFLGIENSSYREGGRLQNYLSGDTGVDQVVQEAEYYIQLFHDNWPSQTDEMSFDVLLRYEEAKLGL